MKLNSTIYSILSEIIIGFIPPDNAIGERGADYFLPFIFIRRIRLLLLAFPRPARRRARRIIIIIVKVVVVVAAAVTILSPVAVLRPGAVL